MFCLCQIIALLAGLLILKLTPIKNEPAFELSTGYYNAESGPAPTLPVPYTLIQQGNVAALGDNGVDPLFSGIVNNMLQPNVSMASIPSLIVDRGASSDPSSFSDFQCFNYRFGNSPIPLSSGPYNLSLALQEPLAFPHNVSEYLLEAKNRRAVSLYGACVLLALLFWHARHYRPMLFLQEPTCWITLGPQIPQTFPQWV